MASTPRAEFENIREDLRVLFLAELIQKLSTYGYKGKYMQGGDGLEPEVLHVDCVANDLWDDFWIKRRLMNRRMQEKLENGEALDVNVIGTYNPYMDFFELRGYIDGLDYCDARRERWVWQIVKMKQSGKIVAYFKVIGESTQQDTLWLR